MTSSNENIFRVTGLLWGESTWPVDSPHQGSGTRSFDVFFDVCLNKRLSKNRDASDLRCQCAHCDVTVMFINIHHACFISNGAIGWMPQCYRVNQYHRYIPQSLKLNHLNKTKQSKIKPYADFTGYNKRSVFKSYKVLSERDSVCLVLDLIHSKFNGQQVKMWQQLLNEHMGHDIFITFSRVNNKCAGTQRCKTQFLITPPGVLLTNMLEWLDWHQMCVNVCQLTDNRTTAQ